MTPGEKASRKWNEIIARNKKSRRSPEIIKALKELDARWAKRVKKWERERRKNYKPKNVQLVLPFKEKK